MELPFDDAPSIEQYEFEQLEQRYPDEFQSPTDEQPEEEEYEDNEETDDSEDNESEETEETELSAEGQIEESEIKTKPRKKLKADNDEKIVPFPARWDTVIPLGNGLYRDPDSKQLYREFDLLTLFNER